MAVGIGLLCAVKVSPSGTRLAASVVTNEQGEICGLGPWTSGPAPAARGLPIENHAFAGGLSPLRGELPRN
jgi:hypothetical protein